MADQLNKDIAQSCTTGRNHIIKMRVMCHKPVQIDNMSRASTNSIYVTP